MVQAAATKRTDQRNVTFWISADELARLDALLLTQCAGNPGVRPSRQGFLLALVRRALSDAAHPALAAHRGRLAEAAALEAGEVRP
jgi:hypothetical protein